MYEIIIERHETKPSVFTSARAPKEGQAFFPDPIVGDSARDRLAHHAYQVLMEDPLLENRKDQNNRTGIKERITMHYGFNIDTVYSKVVILSNGGSRVMQHWFKPGEISRSKICP